MQRGTGNKHEVRALIFLMRVTSEYQTGHFGNFFRFLAEPIHVNMMSAGCDDPPSDRCGDSSIMIDGIEVSPKVSYVFVLSGYQSS